MLPPRTEDRQEESEAREDSAADVVTPEKEDDVDGLGEVARGISGRHALRVDLFKAPSLAKWVGRLGTAGNAYDDDVDVFVVRGTLRDEGIWFVVE